MGFLSDLVKGSLSVASPSRVTLRTIHNPGQTLTHPYDTSGPLTARSQIDSGNVLGLNPDRVQSPNFQQPTGGIWGQYGNRNQYFNNALARALQSPQQQAQWQPYQPQQQSQIGAGAGSALLSSDNPAWKLGGQGQVSPLFQLGGAQPPPNPMPGAMQGMNPNARMGELRNQQLGGSYA